MSQETKLILPFSVPASNRVERFDEEMEQAAIFCLAELERSKGTRIVAKQLPEKLNFIAKVSYPFLLYPFQGTSLVLDGLNVSSHTFSYPAVQNTQVFMDSIKRSSDSRQAYTAFLSDNLDYFQVSSGEESIVIEGLMADPAFLKDFEVYLSEAGSLDTSSLSVAVIPLAINHTLIEARIRGLDSLRAKFISEARDLNKSMRLLDAATKEHAESIQEEMEEARHTFDEELEKRKGPVEEKVKDISRKGDTEMTLASKRFEKDLLHLQKEKVKREKGRDQLASKIAHCEAGMKTSASRKDDAGERRWKEERKKRKRERSEIESEIKKIEKEIKETEDSKSQELFKIRSDIDARVQEATRELLEIESARDAKIQILTQEIGRLRELTSTTIKHINKTVELRENAIAAFVELGVSQKHEQSALVCVPFYLACFQSGSRKRYVHYPPSKANSVKFLVKLKGALGMTKIKQLFSPRSEAVSSLLNRFPSLMEENAVLEKEVWEVSTKVDILRTQELRESIKRGFAKLREENWFSDKEYEEFYQKLA